MLDPKTPFQASVDAARPSLVVRTIAGFVLTAAHVVFSIHMLIAMFGRARPRGVSWHRPRPIEVDVPARSPR